MRSFQLLLNNFTFRYYLKPFFLIGFLSIISLQGQSQILFSDQTFVGGVTVGGHSTIGELLDGSYKIRWDSDYKIRSAYAILYRHGNPPPHTIYLNHAPIDLNFSSQVSPTLPEINPESTSFAVHVIDISNNIEITDDSVSVDLPEQEIGFPWKGNWGWWGVYVVIYYTSPNITTPVTNRIYIANQSQDAPQSYQFDKPDFEPNTPVLFAIYSHRLADFYDDATRIELNNQILGDIWKGDLVNPVASSGVQGHFYYENSMAEGLNGDTANDHVYQQDGIAVINNYLSTSENQSTEFYYNSNPSYPQFNPHPAFLITYTPSCQVTSNTMPREYTTCYQQSTPRGQPDKTDSLTLQALPGYDHYDWTPGTAFNDSTLANPTLKPDSSGWYRVRMWSDDPAGLCAQTIPVFVTVGEVPRPGNLKVSATSCPAITGRIEFKNMAGQPPFQYTVNDHTQSSAIFDQLESGSYALSVVDHLGCTWDTTVVVPFSPPQQAAFTANPEAGYSPLSVSFYNESTNANSYQWLIDGEAFSTTKNTFYTFPDSGTYSIALVAYGSNTMCSDTAYITITVDQGLELIVPNIITPNGDGMNDALVAKIAGVRSMHWEVFNRWGNTLFSGDALKPVESYTLWSPAKGEYPAGVYTVVLTLEGNSGEVRKMAVQVMVK